MPNPFQSIGQANAPFGGTKETDTLIPHTGKSIAVALFSDFDIGSGGWTGTPATWAGINSSVAIGFVDILGQPTTQAGPMTNLDGNRFNWASLLLLFAANANFGFVFNNAVTSGAYGGTQSVLINFDIPAGSTLLAVQQGTALFFSSTPDLGSVSDTAGNVWSPVVKSIVPSGLNVFAEAAVSVAMNVQHSAIATNTVSMVFNAGGNNAQCYVICFTGAIPFNLTGEKAFGSMLL